MLQGDKPRAGMRPSSHEKSRFTKFSKRSRSRNIGGKLTSGMEMRMEVSTCRNARMHNARMEINHMKMQNIAPDKDVYEIKATDNYCRRSKEMAQDVRLTIGTPIMAIRKQKEFDVCNGDWLEVAAFDKQKKIITLQKRDDNSSKEMDVDHFMCNFVVAHAITTHKAQSAEYNFKYCIWETEKMQKIKEERDEDTGRRLMSVAISRAKTPNQIKIVKRKVPYILFHSCICYLVLSDRVIK
jgi:hypothetical protein